jgi:hypothetical protein
MFAPENSKPPYYPSYLPPEPAELQRLFQVKAYLPVHGTGVWNETWKIQHGVYLTEEKESEMGSSEVQKTAAQLEQMKKIINSATKKIAQERAAGVLTAGIESSLKGVMDPSVLIYSDPHAYTAHMEKQAHHVSIIATTSPLVGQCDTLCVSNCNAEDACLLFSFSPVCFAFRFSSSRCFHYKETSGPI